MDCCRPTQHRASSQSQSVVSQSSGQSVGQSASLRPATIVPCPPPPTSHINTLPSTIIHCLHRKLSLALIQYIKIMIPNKEFYGVDHVTFWVGNALQAATWYTARLGFETIAYRGLENGDRQYSTHVVRQGRITLAFTSALDPQDHEFARHMRMHGDGVKDIAFSVSNVHLTYNEAILAGAQPIHPPRTHHDANGSLTIATIASAYGDTTHTFVERSKYDGAFLPGYEVAKHRDPLAMLTPPIGLLDIDHIVSNHPENHMERIAQWYEQVLNFHRFWSIDDKSLNTEFSSMRTIAVTDDHERVKLPLNEPASGKRKSQIQEYVDYYAGSGVQHIALTTDNIIESAINLRKRGIQFLNIPTEYYTALRKKLATASIKVREDIDVLEQLQILVDYDDKGYLLQIFTKNAQDRPTVFFEIIQRNNFNGFGAGNFKALFEAVEREQLKRGNQ
ncbi:hypothetical protein SAMD00019534_080530 [Acytostelium subglobosum LB1]|uniref:hypothetical protein n=1 Tax=Acytostelium subglobosum LB1 TaxID=1410327 RepID=UPI000644A705|nr:hypothetical protein SAMD00019534_080530 [Acytostelium subglobosum LB1]GAM24878.1 hypothetical protein SAMD00019534_080530 [Acytostelium subglobosum LB1]|eukprot:XP_012751967.1 hypothetical protein SAMD00019534_080530 [Acytostelium subglobosum LB1]